MVNVVTKKPLSTPYYALQQQFGSYDFYRTTIDATGPLNKDKSLTYRFDLGYTSQNSFRDFIEKDRVFVAPSLHWQATADTEFNLNLEYMHDNPSMADTGLPAIGNRVVNMPINRNYSQPGPFGKDTVNSILIDFNWSHAFNDNWKVSNGIVANQVEYNFRDLPVAYIQPLLEDADPQVRRGTYFEDFNRDNYTVYLNLNGKFETFGLKHKVLLGGDFYNIEQKNSGFFGLNHAIQRGFDPDAGAFDYFSFVSLNNPNYASYNRSFAELDNLRKNAPNDFAIYNSSWYGLYFQDQISLFDDKVQILGGGRYDWTRQSQGTSMTSYADIERTYTNVEHFSPRVGLLYRPWKWLSVYGNRVESFGINNNLSASGTALTPETSEQYEAGFKMEWLDGKLSTNLAYYHLNKQNILKQVNENTFSTVGGARSQGVEFDMSGQITDALSLIASYAYTNARITKDFLLLENGSLTSGNQGNRLPGVPEHSGSTWLKYALQDDTLRGLSFGVGTYLVGKREGDSENSYQLPGYVRVDTSAAYSFNLGPTRLTTQLNVYNIFDKRYYYPGQPYNTSKAFNMIGDPLTFLGSIKLEY